MLNQRRDKVTPNLLEHNEIFSRGKTQQIILYYYYNDQIEGTATIILLVP